MVFERIRNRMLINTLVEILKENSEVLKGKNDEDIIKNVSEEVIEETNEDQK